LTDPLGNQTSYTYDAASNLVQTQDALNNITQMAFDADWNRTSLTDANGHQTQWMYDSMARVIKRTDPLQRAVTVWLWLQYGWPLVLW
jgi:YD repeat-containing protein